MPAVAPEILKQVKGIELRTRALVGSLFAGEYRSVFRGQGMEVAEVLALAAAYHNDRVGALLFADEVEQVIPPGKGRRHALRVIRALVAFEPAGQRTNLAASLSYASRLLRHRSIVVILSDFIASGWDRPLRRLAARHEVVAITVDDPREHHLPESGWIEMLDAETGRRALVDTGSREVRERVRALAERRREERAPL